MYLCTYPFYFTMIKRKAVKLFKEMSACSIGDNEMGVWCIFLSTNESGSGKTHI